VFGILTITIALAVHVQAQSFLTNGLVAYYPFNGNDNDASGNGNNGIVNNAFLVADRFGNGASAYEFDGSNSVITVDSLASTNLAELTLSVWIDSLATPTDGEIIDKWRAFSYSLDDYSLTLTSSLQIFFANGRHGTGYGALPNNCVLRSTNLISVGKWYQIVATIDSAGTGTLWINGI